MQLDVWKWDQIIQCGIVSLPNIGKSTFFNVLTKTQIAAVENFPFCTINPNVTNALTSYANIINLP